jgi:predicted KAP-like P-loop ATPase
MWSDNETKVDLIGFKVHADLIRSVVTDSHLLPVVLGVFGDWGGGKSSIMRMLEHELNDAKYEDTACLYFNGWMFESYEDAKTALLSSILVQLGEHKRFGPKVKEKAVGLLKRIKLMEVAKLGVKHIGVPLAVGAMTGGVGAIPAAFMTLLPELLKKGASGEGKQDAEGEKDQEDENGINWAELIREAPEKPDLLEVRKFRDDFDKMLAETDIRSLVVLIDDLDRCLPERIIETLEAIKLFVAVPKTAFVIGADPRIVRHAIATRYAARHLGESEEDGQEIQALVKDYLEKLIQIPYHLPRLSPAEIETYINLLACQKNLSEERFGAVLNHWGECRRSNFYSAYQQGAIREALGGEEALVEELGRQLSWSNAIAPVITDGLKGNPRQVKRMLNAMLLRKRLAEVAGIGVRDEVLAKLMVLEYSYDKRFEELNTWQVAEDGFPEKLRQMERAALENDEAADAAAGDSFGEWNKPSLLGWLKMPPALADVDLRDYFWLARDRTSSTLVGVNLVSPLLRRLFDQLTGDNSGEKHIAVKEAAALNETECESLLQLLQQQVERYPDRIAGPEALDLLAQQKIEGAAQALSSGVRNTDAGLLDPGVAFRVQALGQSDPNLMEWADSLLEYLVSRKATGVGKAAEKALKDLRERK